MIAFGLGAAAMLAYVVLGFLVYRWWYAVGPEGLYGWRDYATEIGILLSWPVSMSVIIGCEIYLNYLFIREQRREEDRRHERLRVLPEFTGKLEGADTDLSTRGLDELRGRE